MKFILSLFFSLFIVGCTFTQNVQKNEPNRSSIVKEELINTDLHPIFTNLNNTILEIANQLFDAQATHSNPTKIILTSFVDLENFDNTSTLGRLLSESMFNELHIRKFIVTDFRGQDNVSVNKDGEFHITRDTEKLKDDITGIEYILVGTYVRFEDKSLLINARIIDSESGKLFSSARVIYKPKNCETFNLCGINYKSSKIVDKTDYLYNTQVNENTNSFAIIPDKSEK